uniref:Lysosomal associated membrane protein family member 5 n=1 Tax=Bubo bubo TaxID=30461 RepID=A0A8C0EKT1_BUBBB
LWPAGKHTASSHRLSALVTPAGKSYECQAQQTISLISSAGPRHVLRPPGAAAAAVYCRDLGASFLRAPSPPSSELSVLPAVPPTRSLASVVPPRRVARGRCVPWPLIVSFGSKVTSVPPRRDLTAAVSALWPAGKHTASSHRLSALVTPAGKSYECQAQQTISLISSDQQKPVQLLLSEVRVQPFDIAADFVFSEEHKCPVDQREQLEETLPLILGLILGLVIVITLCVYHIHHKLTANQVQIPRDRSQYKHMG